MRLNLGCGNYPLPGWINIDLHPPADVVGDFTTMTYGDVDQIRAIHVLEHISWRETATVLRQLYSWLAPGGTLTIEVPDMRMILTCGADYPAWQQWVYGEQSHDGEYHKAGFTSQSLSKCLGEAGFLVLSTRAFLSDHPMRSGFPCVEAQAVT